jgi:GNAT superfamily N-acetyltransferase
MQHISDRPEQVTTPTSSARVYDLAGALARAFYGDPIFGWLIPNAASRRARLQRFFRLELGHVVLPAGRAVVAAGDAGVSLELPPGAWRMPFRAQLAHGPTFARVFGSHLPHALALTTRMERRHVREPHYYIPYVGVAPESQGQGIGTALLRETLDRSDRERLPAYLEATSESNAALYSRMGFEHLGEFSIASSPPLWPMRRPPRS